MPNLVYRLHRWGMCQVAICSFAIIVFAIIVASITLCVPVIRLDDAKILYFSSTGAQVIAALFGMTVAGYSFFMSRFGPAAGEDNFETYEEIEQAYHVELSLLAVVCCVTIAVLIANTVLSGEGFPSIVFDVLLNASGLLVVVSLVLIAIFIVQVVDPRQASKYSAVARKGMEELDAEEGDLIVFLRDYNEAEAIISKRASDLPGKTSEPHGMMQALGWLRDAGEIPPDLYGELNILRRYRNYAVHSFGTQTVSKGLNDQMASILKWVKREYGGHEGAD